MKLHTYVQYYLGLTFEQVLNRRLKGLASAKAKARDGLAYAKAMYAYHHTQVMELNLSKYDLLEAQLSLLEAQEGIDYANSLLKYYEVRAEQVNLLLQQHTNKEEQLILQT